MRLWPGVFATAESKAGFALVIVKERRPGQVIFELITNNVDAIHRLNSYANELLGQFCDLLVLTDNLPVEFGRRVSAFAAKNNKHRHSSFLADLLALGNVENPFNVSVDLRRSRVFLEHRLTRSKRPGN